MRFRPLSAALAALTMTALALGMLPASTATAGGGSTLPPRTYVTGWLPYWLAGPATDSVVNNAAVFDDASPFVFDVWGATKIDLMVSGPEWHSMRSRLRQAGVAIIPTFASHMTADGFASMLTSKRQMNAHVDALVSLAKKYNLDGIDLDYESINFGSSAARQTVRNRYPVFAHKLAARLHAAGRILSVTVAPRTSAGDPNWYVYDYKALGAAADRIRIMTYDYHWNGGPAGPIAPKWWVKQVISFAVTQIDSTKISLGLPAYGRDWFVKTLSGSCPSSARTTISRSTSGMQRFAASIGKTPRWNSRGTSRTFTYTEAYSSGGMKCRAKRAVWFDDARSVAAKIQLVGKYQLRGVAMWALGYESPATWSKLKTYGQKIAARQPSVTLKAPATVVYGDSGSVSATLTDGGQSVDHLPVVLQRRALGSKDWVNVASRRTNSHGHVGFPVAPQHHVQWRVVTGRSWQYLARTTAAETTRVAYAVGLDSVQQVSARGSRWSLTGSVKPAVAGTTVVRQKSVNGTWVDKATQNVAADGTFSFAMRSRVTGDHLYRVVALPGSLDRGTSRTVNVVVG